MFTNDTISFEQPGPELQKNVVYKEVWREYVLREIVIIGGWLLLLILRLE